MPQVLASTQTTSDEFVAPSWAMAVELTGHAGGTWRLQCEGLDGTWYDVDGVEFTQTDQWYVRTIPGRTYRLTGGSAGAEAWAGRWRGNA